MKESQHDLDDVSWTNMMLHEWSFDWISVTSSEEW